VLPGDVTPRDKGKGAVAIGDITTLAMRHSAATIYAHVHLRRSAEVLGCRTETNGRELLSKLFTRKTRE
jgi:hypothetical protein